MNTTAEQDIRRDVNVASHDVDAAAAELKHRAERARVEDANDNPASLSANPAKTVPRNKPQVQPPFVNVPFGKFLTYLVLGLVLLSTYYVWKFHRFANEVGGYWNAVRGAKAVEVAAVQADKAAESAASVAGSKVGQASATGGSKPLQGKKKGNANEPKNKKGNDNEPKKGSKEDVQAQVFRLAQTLGVKPAELSNAIRHLIDPTAPKPGAGTAAGGAGTAAGGAGDVHAEAKIKADAAASAAADAAASDEPGFLEVFGEALLD